MKGKRVFGGVCAPQARKKIACGAKTVYFWSISEVDFWSIFKKGLVNKKAPSLLVPDLEKGRGAFLTSIDLILYNTSTSIRITSYAS